MPISDPQDAAVRLLDVIQRDGRAFETYRNFYRGTVPLPPGVMAQDPAERMTAENARLNVTALVVDLPAQEMRVEGFRSGGQTSPTVWDAWQRSSMDALQSRVARAALTYGQAWTVTEVADGQARTRTLPTRRTAGLFFDPANDSAPIVAMTLTAWPTNDADGSAVMWDDTTVYTVVIPRIVQNSDGTPRPPYVANTTEHGVGSQPVTRFPAIVDDDGVTSGIVERCIDPQMNLNSARFHLMDASASSAAPIRMITGLERNVARDADGNPVTGPDGQVITKPVQLRRRDLVVTENEQGKLQQAAGADLSGHLATVDHALKSLAMIAQATLTATSPNLVNLSADALVEARRTQTRHISAIQTSLGESWERVMRLMAGIDGDDEAAQDWRLETVWRDVSGASIASVVDAIVKLASVGVPVQPMLARVPDMTQTERDQIESMMSSLTADAAHAQALADNVSALSSVQPSDGVAGLSDTAAQRRADRLAQATS